MTVAAAGCGKKKTTETAPVEVTATPTPEVTKAVDMVDMQQTADEDIKNIMGEKTSTASKIVFVNNTGDDIQSLYIRTHVDEDSEDYDADEDGGWGDDLINGMFTLTDKDKALYYMQTANTQTSGTQTTSNKSTASYDIRIAYTDEDKNECFFRDIPLGTISQITLCMDGTDDDAIPYAKYLTGTSTKEVSTLDAVKERLGITDDSKSESDSTDDSDKNSTDNSDSADNNNSGDQNTDDNGNGSNNGSDDGDLITCFSNYKQQYKESSLKLVMVGGIFGKVPDAAEVIYTGFVSDEEKIAIIQHAFLVVNPSQYESLSLILLETLNLEIPMLVNGRCAVLKEHCKLSHGAVDYYMNEQQFIRKLNKIESFPVFREQMAKGGKQYVDNNYNWNLILSRLKRVIELVAKSKQRK